MDYETFKACQDVCRALGEVLTSESLLKKARSVYAYEILLDKRTLCYASLFGDAEEVSRLLSGLSSVGVDANFTVIMRYNNVTPLHCASETGHAHVVKLLLHEGAVPNLATEDQETQLYKAAYYGRLNVVRLLLKAGADPNKGRLTPLYWAATNDAGADPNEVGEAS